MENNRGMFSIGDFNEGGAEPDRSYPMQASKSEIDLSSLHVTPRDEYLNFSHTMARHFGDTEALGFNRLQRSGIFEGDPAKELTVKTRGKEEFRKVDIIDDDIQVFGLISVRHFCSQWLSVLKDIHQISKQQSERIENLNRKKTTFCGLPEFEISPIPASIPGNKTNACPEAITDPQEQKNEPNNQEPDPGVNTSKKRRYGKFKGIQPLEIKEVPVDSHSGPSVPLLIGIPATDVLSVGRGSHAEEASQKGRVRRKCDQCCCTIM